MRSIIWYLAKRANDILKGERLQTTAYIAKRQLSVVQMLSSAPDWEEDKAVAAWIKSEISDSLAQHAIMCVRYKWNMDELMQEGLIKVVERVSGVDNNISTSTKRSI